jgi:uncharacterized protein YydD (DUF2326 family)
MKLRAIYSNSPDQFPRIDFHDGLNVIFAKVRDPRRKQRDSHNLGKTFLIRVLDYAFLTALDKDHPFKVHQDVFSNFVFFLEVETVDGMFVTVRRAVSGRKAICINVAKSSGQDYSELPTKNWLHSDIGQDKARNILDKLLALSAIRPYLYRKGLGYFLRRQADYNNEFLISRFGRGKDRDWKPFMSLLLGFDHNLVSQKYELDKQEEVLKSQLKIHEASAGHRSEQFDELKGVIDVKEREVSLLRMRVNKFDFAEVESEITQNTVRIIESEIADINERRYGLHQEQAEIEHTLQTDFGFDVDDLRQIFTEAEITLPCALLRSYEELVEFNERISTARKNRLRDRARTIAAEISRLNGRANTLNKQRMAALEIVTNRATLVKYRCLQKELLVEEEQLVQLRAQLRQADRAADIQQELRRIDGERNQLVDQIVAMIRTGNDRYTSIRENFANLAKSILFVPAIMSVTPNKQGNMEFRTRIVDRQLSSRETEEGEGTSYKKVLCACFDLALLSAWSNAKFYRFVYHDGVFEGLDNRRKVSLLSTIRRVCEQFGLQYILTVIDSDLPRNEEDEKLLFRDTEIVRELDDTGDKGRLFRMPAF